MTATTPQETPKAADPGVDDVVVRRRIPAPRDQVFAAWLDPAQLARFMTPAPGMTVPTCETDPKEGGRFRLVMKAGDQEIPHAGTYREIRRPERLVFTWESPFSPPDSTVTLDFAEAAGGGTDVTLTHRGFATQSSRDDHEGGWGGILDALGKTLG